MKKCRKLPKYDENRVFSKKLNLVEYSTRPEYSTWLENFFLNYKFAEDVSKKILCRLDH